MPKKIHVGQFDALTNSTEIELIFSEITQHALFLSVDETTRKLQGY